MMYSTSPSSSSMASSSGRTSPEQQSSQTAPQPARSNAFLLPQLFFSSPSDAESKQERSSRPVANALLNQPRRTSFGAAISPSSRFSALSAFGYMSPGLSSSPPSSFPGLSSSQSPGTESLSPSPTNLAVQETREAAPAPPKRHLCMPDGMGGTMCLEVKDRSRSVS